MGHVEMFFVRLFAGLLGLCAIALGLLWVGQGTNVLAWPHDSFMIADRAWAVRGAVLASVGGIVIWLATRRNGHV